MTIRHEIEVFLGKETNGFGMEWRVEYTYAEYGIFFGDSVFETFVVLFYFACVNYSKTDPAFQYICWCCAITLCQISACWNMMITETKGKKKNVIDITLSWSLHPNQPLLSFNWLCFSVFFDFHTTDKRFETILIVGIIEWIQIVRATNWICRMSLLFQVKIIKT